MRSEVSRLITSKTGARALRYRSAGKPAQPLNPTQEEFRQRLLDKLASGQYLLEDVPACLCGSQDSTPVADRDRFGLPIGVAICRACGLLRTTPRLAAQHLTEFYEDDYHGLHFALPTPSPEHALYRVGQGHLIFEYVRGRLPQDNLTVAEIGCGTGSVLREFADAAASAGHSVRTFGCEYAASYVAAGRSLGTDIRQGGLEALMGIDPPSLVILSHVLEHFADVPAELARLRRLVVPDTMVYVEVPGVLSIHKRTAYEYEFLRYLTVAHTYHFCLDSLVTTMERSGFSFVTGDHEVRSLFLLKDKSLVASEARPSAFDETYEYLMWLDRSWFQRVRRMWLRLRNQSRALCRNAVELAAGERGLTAVRTVLHSGKRHWARVSQRAGGRAR